MSEIRKFPSKLAPPPPKRGRLGAPPAPIEAPNNLNTSTDNAPAVLQDMNFKVPPVFHATFKGEAALRGLSMKEMLEAAFKCYLDTYGSLADPDRRRV